MTSRVWREQSICNRLAICTQPDWQIVRLLIVNTSSTGIRGIRVYGADSAGDSAIMARLVCIRRRIVQDIPACPLCAMENTYPDADNYVCADCGHEWPIVAVAADDAERVIKD